MRTRRADNAPSAALPRVPRQADGRRGAAPSAVPAAPVRARRRPALVAAGVALVVAGGLGSAWLFSAGTGAEPVLALARDVPQGQALSGADLVAVRIAPDPRLATVASSDLEELIGKRTATALTAGSLLTPMSTTTAVVPGDGESVVGVALSTAQMPAELLVAGDHVRIVSTPPTQADPPAEAPASVQGEVVAVAEPDPAGARTVDVVVPSLEAAELAARAATGRVALVLDSRVR